MGPPTRLVAVALWEYTAVLTGEQTEDERVLPALGLTQGLNQTATLNCQDS